jgi:hypothetical protein
MNQFYIRCGKYTKLFNTFEKNSIKLFNAIEKIAVYLFNGIEIISRF